MTEERPHCTTVVGLERFLLARIEAIETRIDEAEDRNKERFASMKAAVEAALVSSDRAITKAEAATEKRFDSVNEFREALADQASNLLPRAEYNVQHQGLIIRAEANAKRIEEMQSVVSALEARGAGKQQGMSMSGAILMGSISAIAVFVAIITVILDIVRH